MGNRSLRWPIIQDFGFRKMPSKLIIHGGLRIQLCWRAWYHLMVGDEEQATPASVRPADLLLAAVTTACRLVCHSQMRLLAYLAEIEQVRLFPGWCHHTRRGSAFGGDHATSVRVVLIL